VLLCIGASVHRLQAQITVPDILSGQELIYSGRFSAAQVYFADLAERRPGEAAGPMLEASALIWWGESMNDESFQVDSIDLLLTGAIARAQTALDSAETDSARVAALFWLGSSYGYRARQAEMRGSNWRAAQDAKAMRSYLGRAVAMDSACVDCLLGLGIYDYALARAGGLAKLVARIIGLGGGDARRALERMRRVSEEGVMTRTEGRWVYASALLREGEKDPASREEALRRIAELAEQFPENNVFRRPLTTGASP
jgi:hypothetical protein